MKFQCLVLVALLGLVAAAPYNKDHQYKDKSAHEADSYDAKTEYETPYPAKKAYDAKKEYTTAEKRDYPSKKHGSAKKEYETKEYAHEESSYPAAKKAYAEESDYPTKKHGSAKKEYETKKYAEEETSYPAKKAYAEESNYPKKNGYETKVYAHPGDYPTTKQSPKKAYAEESDYPTKSKYDAKKKDKSPTTPGQKSKYAHGNKDYQSTHTKVYEDSISKPTYAGNHDSKPYTPKKYADYKEKNPYSYYDSKRESNYPRYSKQDNAYLTDKADNYENSHYEGQIYKTKSHPAKKAQKEAYGAKKSYDSKKDNYSEDRYAEKSTYPAAKKAYAAKKYESEDEYAEETSYPAAKKSYDSKKPKAENYQKNGY